MRNSRQIALYLALVVAGSVVFNVLIVKAGGMANPATGSLITALMWTPGIAALLTKLVATRSLAGLGWWPRQPSSLLIGWTIPIIYGGLPFLIAGLAGGGTFDLTGWSKAAQGLVPGASPLVALLALAAVGTLLSLLTATGEEIGWRGFLTPALAERYGFWAVSAISAVIWIAYHLPLILFAGYSGAGTPLWFNLVCFAALVLVMNPILTALRLRSGSFWPTALAHASHNLFIQSIFATALIPNAVTPWLVGEFGLITPVAAALVTIIYFRWTGVPVTNAVRA